MTKLIEIRKNFDFHKKNNLICNDSIKILPSIPDNYIDHCFTDPPYSISHYDMKGKEKLVG